MYDRKRKESEREREKKQQINSIETIILIWLRVAKNGRMAEKRGRHDHTATHIQMA